MTELNKRPLQIGITGGIGSGKSIVCKIFSCLGISVYDADSRAKWLTNNNREIRDKVTALLGERAYNAGGTYDRSYVSSMVFTDDNLLKKLNAIIHPIVMEDTDKWFAGRPNENYLIKEAAIMNKAGENNSLDFVIVVKSPVDLRIKRVLARDQRTEEEIRTIIERQISDEERDRKADFIITNDEENSLIPQVVRLHNLFLKGA